MATLEVNLELLRWVLSNIVPVAALEMLPCLVQVVKYVTNGGRLPVPSPESLPGPPCTSTGCLQQYIALLNKCCAHAPAERPCFAEISDCLR